MADLMNDGFLPFTPTGSDGKGVGLTGLNHGGGQVFGLVTRPVGVLTVDIRSGSLGDVSLSGSFTADNSDVVAAISSSTDRIVDAVRTSSLDQIGAITGSSVDVLIPHIQSGSIGAVLVQKAFDIGSGNSPIYVGYAPRGLSTGSAGWTIKRVTQVAGSPTGTKWTDEGVAVWTDRASEAYS